MNKKELSERDICTKFILPALVKAGWDEMLQLREEFEISRGRIVVRGKLVSRAHPRRADYVLCYKPNIPVAVIEAKNNARSVGAGMQQALEYAETLNVPFAISSNGDGFVLPEIYADRDFTPLRNPPVHGQQDYSARGSVKQDQTPTVPCNTFALNTD